MPRRPTPTPGAETLAVVAPEILPPDHNLGALDPFEANLRRRRLVRGEPDMVLTVQTTSKPPVTITRQATKVSELVYLAVANKPAKYPQGQSRIVYIGTTKNGAERIAASAAKKAKDMLGLFGVTHLEFYVVTSRAKGKIKTWHKLERGLLLAFRDSYGCQPLCNIVGKKLKWTDELDYFTCDRLCGVIAQYSAKAAVI
jgi:hypothetical protein